MGSNLSRMFRDWWHRNERRVLIVGLDNAGKTSTYIFFVISFYEENVDDSLTTFFLQRFYII